MASALYAVQSAYLQNQSSLQLGTINFKDLSRGQSPEENTATLKDPNRFTSMQHSKYNLMAQQSDADELAQQTLE